MNLIFGTHKVSKTAITTALKLGYKVIDTATGYQNAKDIDEAVKATGTHPMILTKFNPNDFKDIELAIKNHREELHCDFDMVFLHSPLETDDDNVKAFRQLKQLLPEKIYGVSNFDIKRLQYMIDNKCKPDIISVEYSPYYQPNKLVNFCQKNNIQVTGYRPTYKCKIFKDDVIKGISEKHQTSISKIVLQWILSKDIVPIVSSNNEVNMNDNLDCDNIILDEDDIKKLDSLNTNIATCMTKFCPHD
jgi:diketogulonate reductase-like aldo/keto reductase